MACEVEVRLYCGDGGLMLAKSVQFDDLELANEAYEQLESLCDQEYLFDLVTEARAEQIEAEQQS